jgi:DNA-directed RNA polymerase subunit RPC12/RpoP
MPPAPLHQGAMDLGPREWKQLAYIDDPYEHFSTPPALPWAKQIKAVAYFSSQCRPEFAAPRLAIASALAAHLGASLHSYGACIHTRELADILPQCVGLPVHNVDHDGPKHCALIHYPFYLALENSESDGYATEKLWQGLLAGSVPVYWGAPDVLNLIPHKDAVIDVRSFDSMKALATYLVDALSDPLGVVFARHTAWKKLHPSEWSAGFHILARRPKSGVFCQVCDWAAGVVQTAQPSIIEVLAPMEESPAPDLLPPVVCDMLANCVDRLSRDDNCFLDASAWDVTSKDHPLQESVLLEVLSAAASEIPLNEAKTQPILMSALSRRLLSPDERLQPGLLRDACSIHLNCPPHDAGLKHECRVSSLSGCIRASWVEIERYIACGNCGSRQLGMAKKTVPNNFLDEYRVFQSSDSRWPRRLPCAFSGTLKVNISSIVADTNPSISTLEVPLSDALTVLGSFDKLHHHFLLDEFKGICRILIPSSFLEEEDGPCIGSLFALLDDEIARVCPERPAKPNSAVSVGNPSSGIMNQQEHVSWSGLSEMHLVPAEDADMQRFWHLFMAEFLPVASAALRMTEGSFAGSNLTQKKLFLYSPTRDWGQNPLHRLYSDLSAIGNGAFEVTLVNGPGPDPIAKKKTCALGPVALPRWDFGWWGSDKVRAKSAGRFVEALARKFLGFAPRQDIRPVQRRDGEREENDIVFQLRTEDDPSLVAYYSKLLEDLHKQGITDFGNQDYSK